MYLPSSCGGAADARDQQAELVAARKSAQGLRSWTTPPAHLEDLRPAAVLARGVMLSGMLGVRLADRGLRAAAP